MIVWVPVAAVVFVAMDFWAAMLHERVWHAWLWTVHRTHHEPRRGRFEANDLLPLLHAPIAMGLILWGSAGPAAVARKIALGAGLGMTLFAVGYLIVHDGVVHERLPVRFLLRSRAIRRIARAHRVHHQGAAGRAPYGLFFGPWELARAGRLKRARRAPRPQVDPSARRA